MQLSLSAMEPIGEYCPSAHRAQRCIGDAVLAWFLCFACIPGGQRLHVFGPLPPASNMYQPTVQLQCALAVPVRVPSGQGVQILLPRPHANVFAAQTSQAMRSCFSLRCLPFGQLGQILLFTWV